MGPTLPSGRDVFVVYPRRTLAMSLRDIRKRPMEELAIFEQLSKSRSRILVYEASCLGTNGWLDLNGISCGRGPRESPTEGEEVDDSSRRRRIELAAIESDLPRVTLRKEGRGVESCRIPPRTLCGPIPRLLQNEDPFDGGGEETVKGGKRSEEGKVDECDTVNVEADTGTGYSDNEGGGSLGAGSRERTDR